MTKNILIVETVLPAVVSVPLFIWTPWGPWFLLFSDIESTVRTPLTDNLIRNKDYLSWMKGAWVDLGLAFTNLYSSWQRTLLAVKPCLQKAQMQLPLNICLLPWGPSCCCLPELARRGWTTPLPENLINPLTRSHLQLVLPWQSQSNSQLRLQ